MGFDKGPQAQGQSNDDIAAFRDELARRNPQFFNVGQTLIDRGLGAADPRFEAFRQAQLGLFGSQRDQALNATRGALSRRGITGSVGLNQLARQSEQFDQREGVVSGRIGLQSLANQQQNLETGFGLQSIGLQQTAAPAALSIAQLNAQNAGQGGGGGGKKGKK